MKKIMFDDKYGLTKAVLEGRKTMTRRVVPEKLLEAYYDYDDYVNAVAPHDIPYSREYEEEFFLRRSPFEVGEVVAVAQKYKDVMEERGENSVSPLIAKAGYMNKMFVKADLMPHQIRITNILVERLRDISDQDCIKEGVGRNSDIMNYSDPRDAFAALIDRISGKWTWLSNPWVFVYEFKLIK